jgi:ketosteroid isomerase-like protein
VLPSREAEPAAAKLIRLMSMDEKDVDRWVERYVRAWETNAPEDIRAIFTEDARYFTAPFRRPWTGQDAIVKGWLGRKDDQGTWSFRTEDTVICDDLAYVRGVTTYEDNEDFANLWVITLAPDGRASEFVEWWMAVTDPEKMD